MKNKPIKIILLIILAFFTYVILDYINLPTILGLKLANINSEVFGILFDATIVIILYVISFFYIEKRQVDKDINSKNTVSILIKKTYEECLGNLEFLDNKLILKQYVIPKIDGNKTDSENKIVHNLQTLPFSSFDTIMTLATNGYVGQKELDEYLDIKKDYQHLVSVKITFYDLEYPETNLQKAMFDDIKDRDRKLKNKLKEILKKFSN